MIGLIWLIQVVHYPLFAKVGSEGFQEYSQDHQRLITRIVLPLMFMELGTSLYLVFSRPTGVSSWLAFIGATLVAVIWLSTFLIQVPQHGQLLEKLDPVVCAQLVQGNWIRTISWSLRGLITGWMVWIVMRG